MKFKFGKRFNFEDFPNLLKCHNELERLTDFAYEKEANYEDGECPKKEWSKALNEVDKYYKEIYSKEVYDTFVGKDLMLMNRKTKNKISFDELFSNEYKDLDLTQKNMLTNIVENAWGYKLPAEYYGKKLNNRKNGFQI